MDFFCSGDKTLSSPGGTGSTNPSQSAISQWVGVCTSCGSVSSREMTAFVPDSFELYIYIRKAFRSGDKTLFSPGGAGSKKPQPINNQPVGLGFPHRAGRY